jgi:hypothetical protein
LLQSAAGPLRGVASWQYFAIDVASAFVWGCGPVTPLDPAVRFTTGLVDVLARDLAAAGWKLLAVSTDNGPSFAVPPSPRPPNAGRAATGPRAT